MTHASGLHIHADEPSELLPVVFLHAFPLHGGMWDAQREALRGRARCVSFDVRGLGQSRPAGHAFMLEHIVDDLFTVLDAQGISSAVLCGLSLGGYVALRAVERAPERVRGLVLSDTQAPADSDAAKLARAEGLRSLLRGDLSSYADAQLKRLLCAQTQRDKPELLEHIKQMITSASVEGIAASLVALATRTDVSAGLARIAVPSCVIVGKEDVVTPPAVARALSEAIPGAHLHVLEGAGHLANLEAPTDFNRLLLALLARIDG